MSKDLILMMKNEPVMAINFNIGKYDVINEKLLPFTLKNSIREHKDLTGDFRYDLTQATIVNNANNNKITSFLAHRVLPITRDNAKKIYTLFNLEQMQSDYDKAKIALLCKAVSLQDNYWVKLEEDTISWENVNLRTNSLSEAVAQVSLHGSSLSLDGNLTTPELTGQGAYAKAWKREEDGLYLHKLGANGFWESKIEAMCSNILDCCNVPHLHYEMSTSTNIQTGEVLNTVKCKCMTDEDISILPGVDFYSYCNKLDLDYLQEAIRLDSDTMYKMMIVDYLISNRDRHGMNWGFFYNCNTMEILGCHPLYDHNNAFDLAYMQDKNAKYQLTGKSIYETAKEAMKHVDFHFIKPITKDLFLTDRQYNSFVDKAKDLGINLTPIMQPFNEQLNNANNINNKAQKEIQNKNIDIDIDTI